MGSPLLFLGGGWKAPGVGAQDWRGMARQNVQTSPTPWGHLQDLPPAAGALPPSRGFPVRRQTAAVHGTPRRCLAADW